MRKRMGIPGTPSHVEYLKKKENEARRHKTHCYYYENGSCTCIKNPYGFIECPGSAHCDTYMEKTEGISFIPQRKMNSEKERKNGKTTNPQKEVIVIDFRRDKLMRRQSKKKNEEIIKCVIGGQAEERIIRGTLASKKKKTSVKTKNKEKDEGKTPKKINVQIKMQEKKVRDIKETSQKIKENQERKIRERVKWMLSLIKHPTEEDRARIEELAREK